MPKLNQIVAVEKGIKNQAETELTKHYQRLQKPALFFGITKTYEKKDEDGEDFPSERTLVQAQAEEELQEMSKTLVKLFDVTATKDWGNTVAKANVVVDDEVLLEDVPITFLLFLEKQLVNLRTDIRKLPVYDTAEKWTMNEELGLYETEPAFTSKGKKIPRNHVKAKATDKHPEQVEVYYEDVQVGKWKTVKYSGAISPKRVRELTERVEKLQAAVKFAREEANALHIGNAYVGDKIFSYLYS